VPRKANRGKKGRKNQPTHFYDGGRWSLQGAELDSERRKKRKKQHNGEKRAGTGGNRSRRLVVKKVYVLVFRKRRGGSDWETPPWNGNFVRNRKKRMARVIENGRKWIGRGGGNVATRGGKRLTGKSATSSRSEKMWRRPALARRREESATLLSFEKKGGELHGVDHPYVRQSRKRKEFVSGSTISWSAIEEERDAFPFSGKEGGGETPGGRERMPFYLPRGL